MNLDQSDVIELTCEITERGNSIRFRGHGGSMHPIIGDGDAIVVKSIPVFKIRLGDIICYHTRGVMIAHRVIKKHIANNEIILLTKGDASLAFDPPMQGGNILGKVITIEKHNLTINLDCKSWCIVNYMIAICSSFTLLIYRRICFLEELLIGNRNNCLSSFGSKFLSVSFSVSFSLFFKLLINFLFTVQVVSVSFQH